MSSEGARLRKIEVMDKTCTVWIVKTGKVTWLAYGQYGDNQIEAKSYCSENDAFSKWRQDARNEVAWS